MQNRVPVPRAARSDLPDFAPVPRKGNRHDGWIPARQKAFIEALADTGSVRRAAAMVNMSQANAYALRRAAGAEGFRQAWDAALDFGLARLKDIAFDRAIEGELVPVFSGGKLMGFTRKHNNALLIFCLRHYGKDSRGKRTTVNYFSTRAGAETGAGAGGDGQGAAAAQASTTTMRTVIAGDGEAGGAARDDRLAAVLQGFEGVQLDAEAAAAIAAVLAEYDARQAEAAAVIEAGGAGEADVLCTDRDAHYIAHPAGHSPYRGALEPPPWVVEVEADRMPPEVGEGGAEPEAG